MWLMAVTGCGRSMLRPYSKGCFWYFFHVSCRVYVCITRPVKFQFSTFSHLFLMFFVSYLTSISQGFFRGLIRYFFGSPSELVRISFGSRSVRSERDPNEIHIRSKEIPLETRSQMEGISLLKRVIMLSINGNTSILSLKSIFALYPTITKWS